MSDPMAKAISTDPAYSESDVFQFIGWLSADIRELHSVEVPKLADSWDRFKARAGLAPSARESL